jgi:sugar phosphate isomerase/epimerase
MVGELATQAALLRTEGVEKVVAKHPEMKIVGKQTANWKRNEAIDLMNNWLVAGMEIDAVAANNDEMAVGAILALPYRRRNNDQDVQLQTENLLRRPTAVTDTAANNQVTLVIEPLNRYESCIVNTAEDVSRFVKEVDHPR